MQEIEAYAIAVSLEPTTIVQRATSAGGGAWVRWKAGCSCSMRTADKIRKFMADNPPKPPATTDTEAA